MAKYWLKLNSGEVIELNSIDIIMNSEVTSAVAALDGSGRMMPIANYASEVRFNATSRGVVAAAMRPNNYQAVLGIDGQETPVIIDSWEQKILSDQVTSYFSMTSLAPAAFTSIQRQVEPEPEPPDPQEIWDALSKLEEF